ncbi:hypothetical protein [Hymenobacter elongatus]|uniref:Uncharacterized protein n=1 Tax=Hymenobacter elongatus TaxID=877208 RepID=A0A4Z0PN79_9BACT|nr:hypothetical protein [Hymenobacter elongatus]TGE18098.1 hypothetical protein E5J99_06075 [Hymenobacter elongatus]
MAVLALAGCQNESVPGPESGTDYYPLEVGRYRIYAVSDTLWANYQRQVTTYQFRETITDPITGAAGVTGYRLVRAKRLLPTDAWRDDSVMVVTPTEGALVLTRNNRRTVELVFPVRKDRAWNMTAFSAVDTVIKQEDESRRYEKVGEPFQVTTGGKTYRYEQTLTTALIDDNITGFDDEYYLSKYTQVYAKGIGPVYRVRRRFNYCDQQAQTCSRTNTRIYQGQSRVEVLLEEGKL